MSEIKLKMIQCYESDHEAIKKLALEAGLSVRKYIAKIVKEKKDETV